MNRSEEVGDEVNGLSTVTCMRGRGAAADNYNTCIVGKHVQREIDLYSKVTYLHR